MVVYLQCSTNNRAETVVQAFQGAVCDFGMPDRVRSDKGGENVDVWRLVYHVHGTESSIITGSSTHNTRIERLWRDVYCCVSSHYYELFYELEGEGKLNVLNETDLFCLHYVFLPRIDKNLKEFQNSWNHHSLSTEQNFTPFQLMLMGLQAHPSRANCPPTVIQQLPNPPSLTVTQHILIPQDKFIPCQLLSTELSRNISPLDNSANFGKDLYCRTISLVAQHLQQGSCNCTII